MRNHLIATIFAVLFASGCQVESNAPAEHADVVVTNGYVYTADESRSIAEAVAISGNEIVFVGSAAEVEQYIGPRTDVRDMGGAMLMPGIHDMHIHALATIEPEMCDLASEPYSLEALVPVLQQCIADFGIEEGEWLIVLQWAFSAGNEPSDKLPNMRAALDAVSTEHPIFLYGNDGHHGAANSLAFSMATNAAGDSIEINAETLETDYASYKPLIAVDANGDPSGGVNEDARKLMRSAWYKDMLGISGDLDKTLSLVADKMAANGITTLQDAVVTPEMLAAYGRLEESGEMTFRLRAAMFEPWSEDIDAIDTHLDTLEALREQYRDYEYVSADGVKLFADAGLEGNPLNLPPTMPIAAKLGGFKQPIFGGSVDDGSFDVIAYVDQESDACKSVQVDPDRSLEASRIDAFVSEFGFYPQQCLPQYGVLEHEEAFIRSYIRKATEAGFHIHVHAVSDKGVRVAVDEFAKVKQLADRNGTSQSFAHVQISHPDDQKRIGELGIAVAFTFAWVGPDLQYDMMTIPFIDEIDGIADLYNPDSYFMQNVYAARSIQDYGGLVVHGSDAPVDSREPRPFANLQQAMHRSDGRVVMNESQRIDIHSAINAFTINGAKLFMHDYAVGSIEVGKTADIIALSQNIVELADSNRISEIADTEVTLTIFDGNVVHDAAAD
jgi:predicted amidohydrolase YtcJ